MIVTPKSFQPLLEAALPDDDALAGADRVGLVDVEVIQVPLLGADLVLGRQRGGQCEHCGQRRALRPLPAEPAPPSVPAAPAGMRPELTPR